MNVPTPQRVTFFARTAPRNLELVEFYAQDIAILKALGYEVKIATRFGEIDWKSDILFIWWWTHALFPVLVARLLRKRSIITGTFNYKAPGYFKDYHSRNVLHRFSIRAAMRLATSNILVSTRELELISSDWKYENLAYSPHIVDLQRYQPGSREREKFVLCIAGQTPGIAHRKCLYELIDAFALQHSEHEDWTLYMAGRAGPETSKLNDYILKKGVSSAVRMLGEISTEEKIDYLQRCGIYAQPTQYEGFGLAIAEAMACAAPVVSSPAGAVPEVVGDSGVLVDGLDIPALSSAITDFIEDPQRRKLVGDSGRKRIEELFPFQRRLEDVKEILGD